MISDATREEAYAALLEATARDLRAVCEHPQLPVAVREALKARVREIVGVLVTPFALEIEACVHLAMRDRDVVGERFRGVRPAAVLRYARLLGRDLDAMFRLFNTP